MNSGKRKLEYGEVTKIACGDMNIRIYDTKDAIYDRVIILDKDGLRRDTSAGGIRPHGIGQQPPSGTGLPCGMGFRIQGIRGRKDRQSIQQLNPIELKRPGIKTNII